MLHRPPARVRQTPGGVCAIVLALCALAAPGCGSLSKFSRRDRLEAQIEHDPSHSITGIQGPTERSLNNSSWKKKREELAKDGDQETTQALAEYDAALELYDQGKWAEAEKKFSALAKKRRSKHESFMVKFRRAWGVKNEDATDPFSVYGDSIEEDAIFMTAESQFAQMHYAKAQDSYGRLLEHYPSTRHLDATTRQLFRIARYWLDFPEDVGETGDADVQLASKEDKPAGGAPPRRKTSALDRVPIFPNLTDETRPLFDTAGRGEQALRSIWLHDATGPLADDALMLAANYNLRSEDFVEARRLYTLLREQYPDSPHLKDAYLLGSHVSLASYQGPAYDGKALEEARELKQALVQVFPDITPEQRKKLEEEIELLKDAEVARLWDLVEFYKVKGVDSAIKLHCYAIINKYPDSKYAERARETLRQVAKKELAQQNSIWNRLRGTTPPPASTTPRKEPAPAGKAVLPDSAPGTPSPQPKPGMLDRLNPLRRPDRLPDLQPIDEAPPPASPRETPQTPGRAVLGASG